MEKAQGAMEVLLLIGGGVVVVIVALLLLTSMESNTETELENTFDAFKTLVPTTPTASTPINLATIAKGATATASLVLGEKKPNCALEDSPSTCLWYDNAPYWNAGDWPPHSWEVHLDGAKTIERLEWDICSGDFSYTISYLGGGTWQEIGTYNSSIPCGTKSYDFPTPVISDAIKVNFTPISDGDWARIDAPFKVIGYD